MFNKVSNSDIFCMASFHHVMDSAKIISLKLWPEVKFLCHLKLLEGFRFLIYVCSQPLSFPPGQLRKDHPGSLTHPRGLELDRLPDILLSPFLRRLIFSFSTLASSLF